MVARKILALVVGVRVLPGQREWSLRLAARTGDSHSSNRGSIPLGTNLMPAASRLFFSTSMNWRLAHAPFCVGLYRALILPAEAIDA
jgi:hypothetical protein